MPETPYRSSNKSHNHCVFLLGGCLAERAFFQKHLLWSMYIYIYIYVYVRTSFVTNIWQKKQKHITFKLSKKPRGVSFHPIRRRYRDENRPRPKHGSHAEAVVLPRSSQGTNYPLRGQAHVNPAAGRIVPSREHVHIPTERENENHQRFWLRRVYDICPTVWQAYFFCWFLCYALHRTFSHAWSKHRLVSNWNWMFDDVSCLAQVAQA